MSHLKAPTPGGTRVFSLGFRVIMLAPPNLIDGDYDGDGELLAADIDRASQAIDVRAPGERYQLNRDGTVDLADHRFLVGEMIGTSFGDADLNGAVEFADFLALSDGYGKTGGWSSGDFDGSGEIAPSTGDTRIVRRDLRMSLAIGLLRVGTEICLLGHKKCSAAANLRCVLGTGTPN